MTRAFGIWVKHILTIERGKHYLKINILVFVSQPKKTNLN